MLRSSRPTPAPSPIQTTRRIRDQFPHFYREPDNPPFTSALDGRPYPYGPQGEIDPEEYDRLLEQWERNRYGH